MNDKLFREAQEFLVYEAVLEIANNNAHTLRCTCGGSKEAPCTLCRSNQLVFQIQHEKAESKQFKTPVISDPIQPMKITEKSMQNVKRFGGFQPKRTI